MGAAWLLRRWSLPPGGATITPCLNRTPLAINVSPTTLRPARGLPRSRAGHSPSKVRRLFAILTVLALSLPACDEAEANSSTGGPRVIVEMSDYRFTPAVIEAPADAPFTIELRNVGRIEHDLTIDALRFKVIVKAGRSATRVVGPLTRGARYDVLCSILGHKQMGMVGSLIVRD